MLFSIPPDSEKACRKYKDGMALFKLLVHLLDQTVEDKIRICFVICEFPSFGPSGSLSKRADCSTLHIAHLLADDMDMQRQACDTSALSKVIAIIKELDTDAYKGETENNKARLLEVSLMRSTRPLPAGLTKCLLPS